MQDPTVLDFPTVLQRNVKMQIQFQVADGYATYLIKQLVCVIAENQLAYVRLHLSADPSVGTVGTKVGVVWSGRSGRSARSARSGQSGLFVGACRHQTSDIRQQTADNTQSHSAVLLQ